MVQIAVAQFAPGDDKEVNVESIRSLIGMAAKQDARLVVLPEYALFTTTALDERIVKNAETVDGPFVNRLGELAREYSLSIVAGMNEQVPGEGRVHNTLVFLDSQGEVAGLYRKLHLYDAFGYKESQWVAPGEIGTPAILTVDDLSLGAQTCYDLRFPEVTRAVVDAGAEVVLIPSEWVPGPLKENHWTTLVRARAIENTVYVAAADQTAPTGCGNSMIVDPMGVILASLGESDGVACADISHERIDEVRAKNPALSARRFTVTPR